MQSVTGDYETLFNVHNSADDINSGWQQFTYALNSPIEDASPEFKLVCGGTCGPSAPTPTPTPTPFD